MNENYKYGTLIAKLMRDKITDEEAKELDDWVCQKDENMKLFEDLINDYKARWAKKWFAAVGISTKGIKWKKTEGWYKSERKVLIDFYILMAAMFMVLVGIYFLLENIISQ